MVPAGMDELPRVRRAMESQKQLGLIVISQFVSFGRSRRPQGESELRHWSGLKILGWEGRKIGGWRQEGSGWERDEGLDSCCQQQPARTGWDLLWWKPRKLRSWAYLGLGGGRADCCLKTPRIRKQGRKESDQRQKTALYPHPENVFILVSNSFRLEIRMRFPFISISLIFIQPSAFLPSQIKWYPN